MIYQNFSNEKVRLSGDGHQHQDGQEQGGDVPVEQDAGEAVGDPVRNPRGAAVAEDQYGGIHRGQQNGRKSVAGKPWKHVIISGGILRLSLLKMSDHVISEASSTRSKNCRHAPRADSIPVAIQDSTSRPDALLVPAA
jgi:hypothetical protein